MAYFALSNVHALLHTRKIVTGIAAMILVLVSFRYILEPPFIPFFSPFPPTVLATLKFYKVITKTAAM